MVDRYARPAAEIREETREYGKLRKKAIVAEQAGVLYRYYFGTTGPPPVVFGF